MKIKELDKLVIQTLQDNYIDLTVGDNSDTVHRAVPVNNKLQFTNSLLAEHGFSALVIATEDENMHALLFDFGFSEHGAAQNAETLNLDMAGIEGMALSHGHMDHTGGLLKMSQKIGKKGIPLVLHPQAFRAHRYAKTEQGFKIEFPALTREKTDQAEVQVVETEKPYAMLGESLLFLGEIPRLTPFEKVASRFKYLEGDIEKQDEIEDDTAIVGHIKGKGLVVLTGCAHSGVVNTVKYAQEVTGVERVHAIMGGFHLTGADEDTVMGPTLEALMEIDPDIIVPTHCTGRDAIAMIENMMPEAFILNMVGTTLTFSA